MNITLYGPGRRLKPDMYNNVLHFMRPSITNRNYILKILGNMNMNGAKNYVMLNKNGKLHGFAIIRKYDGIMVLDLIGANRGKGYGRQMMERIINNAKKKGVETIFLNSVPSAVNFYKKFGFTGNTKMQLVLKR
jgi:N-acetylglutamate synthase-like GNAT family acetyltransferase